jgi:hypothetical protein
MQTYQDPKAFRDACLAYRVGACASSVCLECAPVYQALRIATVTLSRWPRPLPKPRQ